MHGLRKQPIYILEKMHVAVSQLPAGGMCNLAQSPSEALQVLVAEVCVKQFRENPNLPWNRIDICTFMNHYIDHIAIYLFTQNADNFLFNCSSFFFRVSSR